MGRKEPSLRTGGERGAGEEGEDMFRRRVTNSDGDIAFDCQFGSPPLMSSSTDTTACKRVLKTSISPRFPCLYVRGMSMASHSLRCFSLASAQVISEFLALGELASRIRREMSRRTPSETNSLVSSNKAMKAMSAMCIARFSCDDNEPG